MQILGFIISYITYIVRPDLLYVLYSKLLRRFTARVPYPDVIIEFPEAPILERNVHKIQDEIEDYFAWVLTTSHKNPLVQGAVEVKNYNKWNKAVASSIPFTSGLLRMLPMVVQARLMIVVPGQSRLPASHLSTGTIDYLLPLTALKEGAVRVASGRNIVCSREGAGIACEDAFPHTIWNDSAKSLIILKLKVQKGYSLPRWARPLSHLMIYLLSNSRRVQHAVEEVEQVVTRKSNSMSMSRARSHE